MSLLYSKESAKDYFSVKLSYQYYLKTKNLYPLLDSKKIEKLSKAGISIESIQNLRDSVFYSAYRESIFKNTEDGYNFFLELDKDIPSKLINEATEKRNIVAYENAKKINTVVSLDYFILKYPSSTQHTEAVYIRDSLALENTKLMNTKTSYKDYIAKYPNSKFLNVAVTSLHNVAYQEAKNNNTLDSYQNFIIEFPESIQVNEARFKIEEIVYKELVKDKSVIKCYSFIEKYEKSIFKDSVLSILEDLKFTELNKNLTIEGIQLYMNEFPSSSKNNFLFNTLDSLYYAKVSDSENINEIEDYIAKFPKSKYLEDLKKKIDYLSDIQSESQFNDVDLFVHPSYFEENTKIEVRNISFFDNDFYQKLEYSTNRAYDLAYRFEETRIGPNGKECHNCGSVSLGTSFKVLGNNWFFWNDKLFKNFKGLSKGIKGGDNKASNNARSYTFSDSIVIDGNGYIVNLHENKLYSYSSCKTSSLLKTNTNIDEFKLQKPVILNQKFKYLPYWANNPKYVEFVPSEHTIFNSNDNLVEKCENICTNNDSLVFFILPIGYSPKIFDYPINKKINTTIGIESFNQNIKNFQTHIDDTEEIGYKYFFRKYNLSETVPFQPKNFTLPKNDAFVILEFNHVLDKLNIIYDAGFSNLMPVKLFIDKTNTLLIVQSVDNIEDEFNSDFSDRFETGPNGEINVHHSVTIFDLETKRELISFPGFINDLTNENHLIINGYAVWTPHCIFYDVLDLNEIIKNKKSFVTPNIINSLELNEFMSSEKMIDKLNLLREGNKPKLENIDKSSLHQQNYSKNYSNNSEQFIRFVEQGNSNLCDCYYEKLNELPESILLSLKYVKYDLNENSLRLETASLNDFEYSYLSDLDCDNWIDRNFPCDRTLSNGLTYTSSFDYDTKKVFLFLYNVKPEFAQKIKDEVKVLIQFDHDMIFNPEKVENYYKNPLIENCIESSNDSNKEKLLELFRSYAPIDKNYVPYAVFNLIIDGEIVFLKYR
jgi:outer membrane protein assembly factor BamD (BamD/ComL family)